ncbi:MAG: ATP-binding protein [Bacteroidota bacterium]
MKTRKPICIPLRVLLIRRNFFSNFLWSFNSLTKTTWSVGILIMVLFPNYSNANENDSVDSSAELWPIVENQLNEEDMDSSLQIALLVIKGYCQGNYKCLLVTYQKLMDNLESRFNIPAAIKVTNEIVKISEKEGDISTKADAYINLRRFHNALGHRKEALICTDNAQQAYEQIGDQRAITRIKIMKEESNLGYRDIKEVLPKLEELLVEVTSMNDSINRERLNLRLIHYTQWAGEYQLMEEHVANAEKTIVPNPSNSKEYYYAIHTKLGRADLTMINEDFETAERHYQKALQLCQEMPDRWLEIKTLYALCQLEMGRAAFPKAKDYLNLALSNAEALNLDDHLSTGYDLAAQIAEAEGQFADALDFTKKKLFHEERLNNKSKGFDPKSFYLEKEKEQLVAEKQNHQLQLRLKESQLRNLLIIIALGVMLILALGVAYQNQVKSKSRLAYQNTLIKDQAEKLAQLDTAKTRFFANVSHELRTPLTLLLGPIKSLIKEKKLSKQQVKLLQLANDSGQQLEQMVTEILDLGKLEIGKMTLDQRSTNLHSFFHPYLLQFESLAQRKKIEYAIKMDIDEKLAAKIDREKCRQVLYNLLSNAFKYTPGGGKIEVRIFVDKGQLHLAVKDSGQGIHAEDLPNLFDRYFQTNQPNKPAVGGSGIGLAICHEYAQLFGGKITVESEPEKGSLFHFQFPLILSKNTEDSADANQLEKNGFYFHPPVSERIDLTTDSTNTTSKPTILLVEDNPKIQDYISLLLADQYHIITAENGKSGLEKLRQTPDCQLIISDLMMPVMDGYQFLEQLKSHDTTRHIPVIMLTARADAKDRLKALRLGVDDYLLKPFAEEELRVRIKNLLKNYDVRKELESENHQEQTTSSGEIITENAGMKKPVTIEIEETPKASTMLSAADHEWLASLEENLQNQLTKFNFKLEHLAELMLVSRRQLGRKVKALTGLTPSEYLLEARLQKARCLLNEKQVSTVKEAAYTVGLRDAKHFSRQFKLRFGKSPSDILAIRTF